ACVVGAIVAWLLNLLLIQPMVRRGAAIVALFVVTLAAAFALDGVILLMFTGTTYAYNLPPDQVVYVGPFQFTYRSLVIIGVSLLVMLVLHVILNYTRFGKAQRAVADSRELARVSGINADGVIRRTWLLAGAVAGFAGFVLAASTGSFAPSIGTNFMLVTFAAAIVGGLGKPYGAVIGALVIGLSMEVSAIYLPANYKDSIAFAVLILTLLFLPNGILATTRENLATQ
ncbi:MAG TPA: branched-chain amino acid ABC transporter permease, partial [Clostridia bacterium]|nr:branched-chain amino acid ABC transporter permease [Clostridia bacterium]